MSCGRRGTPCGYHLLHVEWPTLQMGKWGHMEVRPEGAHTLAAMPPHQPQSCWGALGLQVTPQHQSRDPRNRTCVQETTWLLSKPGCLAGDPHQASIGVASPQVLGTEFLSPQMRTLRRCLSSPEEGTRFLQKQNSWVTWGQTEARRCLIFSSASLHLAPIVWGQRQKWTSCPLEGGRRP